MDKLELAKSKLMLEHPYFGAVVTNLKIINNKNIPSVAKKGDILEVNSEYLEVLEVEEVCSILANASLHQALFHQQRGSNKIASVWNLASDYAINEILVKNGFKMPPLANYSSRFERLYAEQIYNIILSEVDLDKLQEPPPKEKLISDYELFLEQITNKFAKQDELPLSLDRLIDLKKESKISWRELLYRYITNYAKIDYSLMPPNKKHLYRGVALPSVNSKELKIAIAIDTSASISKELLDTFLTEVEFILELIPNYEIELIECDYKIQNTTRLKPMEPLIVSAKGGGTTDFRPVFKYLEELNEDFKLLIYFSDAQGVFPKNEPLFDTLWVLPKDNEVAFGKKIVIDL